MRGSRIDLLDDPERQFRRHENGIRTFQRFGVGFRCRPSVAIPALIFDSQGQTGSFSITFNRDGSHVGMPGCDAPDPDRRNKSCGTARTIKLPIDQLSRQLVDQGRPQHCVILLIGGKDGRPNLVSHRSGASAISAIR